MLDRRTLLTGLLVAPLLTKKASALSSTGTTPDGTPFFYDLPSSPAAGHPVVVVAPVDSSGYAGLDPTFISQLLAAGYVVVGFWLKGLDGAEVGFGAQYQRLNTAIPWFTSHFGFDPLPSIYAQSKGGLDLLPWMRDNPTKFRRAALLYAACDPLSYPFGIPSPPAAAGLIAEALSAYNVPDVSTFTSLYEPTHNALNGASVLPGANIMEWAGDADTAVPLANNGALLSAACGSTVRTIAGMGHVGYLNNEITKWLTGQQMIPTGTDFLRLTLPATITLSTGSAQQVIPSQIVFDADTLFNPTTGVVTIKTPGLYRTSASALFRGMAAGASYYVGIQVNNTWTGQSITDNRTSQGIDTVSSCGAEMYLFAGDTLILVAAAPVGAQLVFNPFQMFWTLAKIG